ncbi:MAG: fasciclin domain-containing protein [Ahrensia sp.]
MRKFIAGAALSLAVAVAAVPAKADNIVEVAQGAGVFGTLIAAAQAAGLDGALANGQNLTVFAPTDEAFAALPAGTVETLLKPENKDQLAAILSYHVLPRELASNQLPGRTIHVRTIKADGDRLLAVDKNAHTGAVTVDGANVVTADVRASNGVIHIIDKVMLPDS